MQEKQLFAGPRYTRRRIIFKNLSLVAYCGDGMRVALLLGDELAQSPAFAAMIR